MKNVTQKSCTPYIKNLHDFLSIKLHHRNFVRSSPPGYLLFLVFLLIIYMLTVQSHWDLKPQNGPGQVFEIAAQIGKKYTKYKKNCLFKI